MRCRNFINAYLNTTIRDTQCLSSSIHPFSILSMQFIVRSNIRIGFYSHFIDIQYFFFFCNFNFQVYAAIQHVKFVSRLLHVNRHSRYIIALTRKNDPTNAPFVIRHLPQRLVTSKCVPSADARTHANISHFYFGFSVYIHIYNLLSSGLF